MEKEKGQCSIVTFNIVQTPSILIWSIIVFHYISMKIPSSFSLWELLRIFHLSKRFFPYSNWICESDIAEYVSWFVASTTQPCYAGCVFWFFGWLLSFNVSGHSLSLVEDQENQEMNRKLYDFRMVAEKYRKHCWIWS